LQIQQMTSSTSAIAQPTHAYVAGFFRPHGTDMNSQVSSSPRPLRSRPRPHARNSNRNQSGTKAFLNSPAKRIRFDQRRKVAERRWTSCGDDPRCRKVPRVCRVGGWYVEACREHAPTRVRCTLQSRPFQFSHDPSASNPLSVLPG
jgi:hypothetical protein